MLKHIAEEITLHLISNKIIKIEERNYYIYGIELFFSNLLITLSILILALIFGKILITLAFAAVFYSLRAYLGGYHCKTYAKCYISSMCIYIGMIVCDYLILNYKTEISVGLMAVCMPIDYFLSDSEHENNPLTDDEKIKYRKIGRALLIIYALGFAAILIFRQIQFAFPIAWAISACAVLILLSKRKEVKK